MLMEYSPPQPGPDISPLLVVHLHTSYQATILATLLKVKSSSNLNLEPETVQNMLECEDRYKKDINDLNFRMRDLLQTQKYLNFLCSGECFGVVTSVYTTIW